MEIAALTLRLVRVSSSTILAQLPMKISPVILEISGTSFFFSFVTVVEDIFEAEMGGNEVQIMCGMLRW